ncbi:MAG: hypothetical protein ACP5I4_17030 [Oceanipulchritudo sp.]
MKAQHFLGWMVVGLMVVQTASAEVGLLRIAESENTQQACSPVGLSADGSTVVGKARDGTMWKAYSWNPYRAGDYSNFFTYLGLGDDKTVTDSGASDVSADGRIVVGAATWDGQTHFHPMIWVDAVPNFYDKSFGGGTANAVSDDGSVIATSDSFTPPVGMAKTIAIWWRYSLDSPPDYTSTDPYGGYAIQYIPMPIWPPPISFPSSSLLGNSAADISGDGSVLVGVSKVSMANVGVWWKKEWGNPYWSAHTVQQYYDDEPPYSDAEPSTIDAASYDGKTLIGNTVWQGAVQDPITYHGFKWKNDPREVLMWGEFDPGQTGIPDDLSNGPVLDVEIGDALTIALKGDGTVAVWGTAYDPDYLPPEGLNGVVMVDAGAEHLLALKADGTVVAWGKNGDGQLTVPGIQGRVIDIAAGYYHNLALTENGTVYAWVSNNDGQSAVPAISGVIDIAAGRAHSVALTADNQIICWGANDYGQAPTAPTPPLQRVMKIASGADHCMALYESGQLLAWGRNDEGQWDAYGVGQTYGIKDVALGAVHSLLLYTDGAVEAWGLLEDPIVALPQSLDTRLAMAIAAGNRHSATLLMPEIEILQPLPPEMGYNHNTTTAKDISGNGEVVVGTSAYYNSGENRYEDFTAVYWDANGVHDLLAELGDKASDWESLTWVYAVNEDGSSMCGYGTYTGGGGSWTNQAWHLTGAYRDGLVESESLDPNWQVSPFYGLFRRAGKSHVYHQVHGFQNLPPGNTETLIVFDYGTDSWLETSGEKYPYMYHYGEDPSWLLFDVNSPPGSRLFFHFKSGEWLTEDELADLN